MRVATRLPSDAISVAASAMQKTAEFSAGAGTAAVRGQKTSATPATPTMAATMVAGRIGSAKNSRMPRVFRNTTSENTTATRPEVRYCSAR